MLSQPVLSQTQLLAMPYEAYMIRAPLTFIKQTPETELALFQENMRQTSEHLPLQQETPDPADRASQEENHSLALRARDRERKHLKTVHAARRRIEEGSYGYCEETGEKIGLQRLLARPTTRLCLEAQEWHERRERQFNH